MRWWEKKNWKLHSTIEPSRFSPLDRLYCVEDPVTTAADYSPRKQLSGYNFSVTLQSRIAAAAEKLRRSGGHPHQVHLTKTDAVQLQYELLAEGGNVAAAIMRCGLQKAVRSILGLKIVWRSPSFHVV